MSRGLGDVYKRQGDRITLGERPAKTVKKLLIDEKIPACRREFIPVIDGGGGAAALGGFGPDRHRLARPGEPALHIILKMEENGSCTRT